MYITEKKKEAQKQYAEITKQLQQAQQTQNGLTTRLVELQGVIRFLNDLECSENSKNIKDPKPIKD